MKKKNKPIRVALTGGIGSGKTTVAKLFQLLGAPIYFSDLRAKQLINNSDKLRQSIIEHFGNESYNPNGSYNTKYIASIVFNNAEQLALLNSIVHPAVFKDQDRWFHQIKTDYGIVENALLFETNTQHKFEKVIVVQSNDVLRIKRIKHRDSITEEEVLKRFNNQLPQEKKVAMADFVIHNNEETSLIKQVLEIHSAINKN